MALHETGGVPQGPLRVRERIAFRELDGEAVVLDLDAGTYFGLNAVGTCAWRMFETSARLDDVVGRILTSFDVLEDVARRDVERFVAALLDKRLLVPADGDAPA